MSIVVLLGLSADWVPTSFAPPNLIPGSTTSATAKIVPTLGTTPYTVVLMELLGSPPTGVSIVQTTDSITGDTLQLASTAGTPEGTFNFSVRVTVKDSGDPTFETVQVEIPVTLVMDATAYEATLIDLLGSVPDIWFKMDDVSGGIVSSGSLGSPGDYDMSEVSDGGAFNGTYQVAGTPIDDEATSGAIQFNGQGALEGGLDWPNDATGTWFWVLKPLSGLAGWVGGLTQNTDIDGVQVRTRSSNTFEFIVQDSGTGDSFRRIEVNLIDGNFHTFAVSRIAGAVFPDLYIDGVKGVSYTETIGTAPVEYWFDDFNEDTKTVGHRGGVDGSQLDNCIIDDMWYHGGTLLSDAQHLELSQAALSQQ